MNMLDILKYGNLTLLHEIGKMPADQWDVPEVCGYWSGKDVMAHLASYEVVLIDVLAEVMGTGQPTPNLDAFRSANFNDSQVEQRKNMSLDSVIAEYKTAHEKVMQDAAKIDPEKRREPGTLPWYGKEYSLDDFVVYSYYGHKREHGAQFAVFTDRFKS